MIKFVAAAIAFSITVIGISFLWPKFTRETRPEPLQKVRDTVIQTDIGREAADILGVAKDKEMQPINISDTASSVAGSIISSLGKEVQQVVTHQVTTQLLNQYKELPPTEQERIQQAVCKP